MDEKEKKKKGGYTCVSSSVKWACFLLLERLADSLFESILKHTLGINQMKMKPVYRSIKSMLK
jgi:hypothetical protein